MATTAELNRICKLAIEVAITAPRVQNKYAVRGGVPWTIIHELRAALLDAGVDLPGLYKTMDQVRKEREVA